MYLLGYDIGSSSIKASLVNAETGKCVAEDFSPKQEMSITALRAGWAEQHPDQWWNNLKIATLSILNTSKVSPADIKAIGISYQMHGLVIIDKQQQVLRPSIIWCDSRAVPYGENAFKTIGKTTCLEHLLNSPGNFTAAKLAWIKQHEPELYDKIDKIMLPGDYIAMRMTGKAVTTISGLSEGIFWDFKKNYISKPLLDYFGFSSNILPDIVPTFGIQGELMPHIAKELGLAAGIPVTYRAGDQPNNALSLNVFNPGEIAATAGTSGVVYGVNAQINYDPLSRVNMFAHVNHSVDQPRLGVLLCINGTSILNTWIKNNVAPENLSYKEIDQLAATVPVGAAGLSVLPFGNGAERVLSNKETGCSINGINFNIHSKAHVIRAAQEGIAFSFKYGIDIMNNLGMEIKVIRAGKANMFLSSLFRETLSTITGATIELYDTDGAIGAAKGAGIGVGIFKNNEEAFASLTKMETITPNRKQEEAVHIAYDKWENTLNTVLSSSCTEK
ncbi:xylulokinase [Microbacter margulisiae]|uniref:Xylulokinase n=1 Tax=Microbacter margulisiae TaxID=1350067 RepID=A0A7W5DQ14_9PORP|nr:FGGY family carbohydrate kinase [Microbacter margulisiae]MBB3186690.1 xylulokinase [Microbacter margulisiae]